jgi:hypothetical protein
MRRFIAVLLAVVLVVPLTLGVAVPAAHAGAATNAALGLASFAVFTQLIAPMLHPRPAHAAYREREVIYERPVYVERPVYSTYPSQVVVVQPAPPPAYPTVIQYPHGRYELRGDGVRYAYQWVWIPSAPPPPPAAPPPPAP